ncbi:putative T5orf172 domain containing protein [Lyophyllum shimeji]|uniref:T5orf172 domain containing protein n=1 Tax=Lyophyllum shimeji TaxID=47721 RepID=A0A9P3PFH5_LYOSH|nr:putative T5orf172 domain containing protein [Lyophyllum shimeji]
MSSTKGKAKRFIHKLLDSFEKDNEQSTHPPIPPPKPTIVNANSAADLRLSASDLVQSFDALALTGRPQQRTDPDFVGGFRPAYRPANPGYAGPAVPFASSSTQRLDLPTLSPLSLRPPPKMPIPNVAAQSLTMQMALRPEGQYVTTSHGPPRPHSASVLPTASDFSSATLSSSPANAQPNVVTPTRSKRPRASSTPASTSSSSSPRQQCAGVTKAGKRCARQVKPGPALVQAQNDAEDGEPPIEVFCFQHTKEVLGPSGYYARKDGKWVEFKDWIPSYLQADTQAALRVEMEKARSQSDCPGYIYTFEIRDLDAPDVIKLKCGSKEQVLRGWYPGTVEPGNTASEGSLMKGRVKAGEKGPWCHRTERLVHLELADLAFTCVYLDPAWPELDGPTVNPTSVNGTNGAGKGKPCADCRSLHKEIFEFKRLRGRRKGKEWELIVQPVILKWGAFVDQCM